MKLKIGSFVVLSMLIIGMFSSCVTSTNVRFETDQPGALILVDGENIGTTPTKKKLSNAVWEDPDVIIKKEGFKDLHTGLDKEVKGVNLVFGIILWWPSLLWVYGPEKTQYYTLIPENK